MCDITIPVNNYYATLPSIARNLSNHMLERPEGTLIISNAFLGKESGQYGKIKRTFTGEIYARWANDAHRSGPIANTSIC